MVHHTIRLWHSVWSLLIAVASLVVSGTSALAEVPDVGEVTCVTCTDDGGGGGGGSGSGGGGWEAGPTWKMIFGSSEEHAQKRRQQGNEFNQQANTAYENGDYATAVRLYQEAYRLYPHEKIAENLRNAQAKLQTQRDEQKREQAEANERAARAQQAQRLDAEQAANIRHNRIGSLAGKLQAISAGVDFDQSGSAAAPTAGAGLQFLPTASGAPPATPAAEIVVDTSVVDLRDAKSLVLDPAKVRGPVTSATPTDLHDTPADVVLSRKTTGEEIEPQNRALLIDFILGRPVDTQAFLNIPPQQVQQYLTEINADPMTGDMRRELFTDETLKQELERSDREGRMRPLVELEVLSRDQRLATEVEQIRDRLRAQELAAFQAAHQKARDGLALEVVRISQQFGVKPEETQERAKDHPAFQRALQAAAVPFAQQLERELHQAHAQIEQEQVEAVQRLRPRTTRDVDTEIRLLRKRYLQQPNGRGTSTPAGGTP